MTISTAFLREKEMESSIKAALFFYDFFTGPKNEAVQTFLADIKKLETGGKLSVAAELFFPALARRSRRSETAVDDRDHDSSSLIFTQRPSSLSLPSVK